MKHQSPSRLGRASGFTLIEMLIVVAIALTLLGITIGAVRGLGSTSSRRAAVGTLMGVFDQARALAISEGKATYVVFASNPRAQTKNQGNSDAFDSTMWGRAYALFQDAELKDGMASVVSSQRSGWMYLPTGVAFKTDASDGTPPAVTDSLSDDKSFSFVSRKTGKSVSLYLPYIKFDTNGTVVDANGEIVSTDSPTLRVLLFEGTSSSEGIETLFRGKAVNAVDGKKYALDEILFKPTTGRARYTLDPVNNLAVSNTSSTP